MSSLSYLNIILLSLLVVSISFNIKFYKNVTVDEEDKSKVNEQKIANSIILGILIVLCGIILYQSASKKKLKFS
jgi:uncharacterized membrane protein